MERVVEFGPPRERGRHHLAKVRNDREGTGTAEGSELALDPTVESLEELGGLFDLPRYSAECRRGRTSS